jgi:hypothetical protein
MLSPDDELKIHEVVSSILQLCAECNHPRSEHVVFCGDAVCYHINDDNTLCCHRAMGMGYSKCRLTKSE